MKLLKSVGNWSLTGGFEAANGIFAYFLAYSSKENSWYWDYL
jgi:hypothetical protein